MRNQRHKESGSAVGAVVVLIVVGLIVISVVRHFWQRSANHHYDVLISAYIMQNKDYEDEDADELRAKLLEGGMFMKMHRWDKESFVRDRELYDEMKKAEVQRLRQREEDRDGFIDSVINL